MKNKLSDLSDHLFAQLERMGSEDLTEDQIRVEVSRAEAMVGLADKIIANAAVQLKAVDLYASHGGRVKVPFLQIEEKAK